MESTTLVTFILNSVHATSAVDILGSWDNFSRPYPMQKDLQKGHGSWYGCHVFKNIICDGDPADCSMPRDGGLVMGGTYWYFYRRNFDQEFHNPEQPSTSTCPLLPGQTVNVLVVPKDPLSQSNQLSEDSQDMSSMTMDPKDRLRAPIAVPRSDKRDAISRAKHSPPEGRINPLFSPTLARLQTGVVDTVISAYMQHKRTEDLISWHHPASSRNIHSASGRLPGAEFFKSTVLQNPTTHKRNDTTGGARPSSRLGFRSASNSGLPHPAKIVREYTNPFLLGTIYDDEAEDKYLTHKPLLHEAIPPSRPFSSGLSEFSTASRTPLRRSYTSPASLPSGALQTQRAMPDELRISGATLIANVEDEATVRAISEAPTQHNTDMEWLNHPPKELPQPGHDQTQTSSASPEMTSGTMTPSNNRPLTRSKSQKLKRLASLKSRIKLPSVPSIPKLKSRRPSTRHESEETTDEKRAVFNEASSTWTPAMTSPSEGSPSFTSPQIRPMADRILADSPVEPFAVPLQHQPSVYGEDRAMPPPKEKPWKQVRPMRGDSLPRIVNNFLPGAFSDQYHTNHTVPVHYPARGSSLPHLHPATGAASSQETITHASQQPSFNRKQSPPTTQKHRADSTLADFSFGVTNDCISRHMVPSFAKDVEDIPAWSSCGDRRESFDEAIHRDQIRSLLRNGTSLGLHGSGLTHKVSFGGGLGQDKEEGFGAESFEYLAAAIY